jgi:sortase (surface protein transpeptidase)
MRVPPTLVRRTAALFLAVVGVGVFAPTCLALPGDTPPQRLVIPSIGVDAAVESVGLEADGGMGAPRSPGNVAWYNLGVAPGRQGNAVMAGHLDDRQGKPAVFWSLDKLQIGQEILVVDGQGSTFKYQVSEVASYRTGTTPIPYVFGATGATRLNLITCTGTWNRDVRLYSHRLVVFADLVGAGAPIAAPPAQAAAAGAESVAAAPGGEVAVAESPEEPADSAPVTRAEPLRQTFRCLSWNRIRVLPVPD